MNREIKLGNVTKESFIRIGSIELMKDSYWNMDFLRKTIRELANGLFEHIMVKNNHIKVLEEVSITLNWDFTGGEAVKHIAVQATASGIPTLRVYKKISKLPKGIQMFVDELKYYINRLETSNIECRPYLTDSDYLESLDNEDIKFIIEKIENLTGELIITSKSPDFNNIKLLEKEGIKVIRGEHDSFGWLSAVLLTKKGSITIG